MKAQDYLRAEREQHLSEAAGIFAKADTEGRPASAEEKQLAQKAMDSAEAIATKLSALDEDEADRSRLDDLGEKFKAPERTVARKSYPDAVAKFFDSEGFKKFAQDVKNGSRSAVAAPVSLVSKSTDPVTDVPDAPISGQTEPGFARQYVIPPLDVASLFAQGTMTGSNVAFLTAANAEGSAEYQSSLGDQKGGTFALDLDTDNAYAKTIAAVATIPSQNLDDIEALEAEVRNILLVGPGGVAMKAEDAYINGDGSAGEIQGILDLSPDDSTLADDYVSKSVFKAMADIKTASGFAADGVVCSPEDWFILSTEVGSSDDRPLFGPWGTGWGQNGIGPRLVVSNAIEPGTILVGAFKAVTRYVRQSATVSADASGLGLRDKNLVLFVAEAREMLLHRYGKRPFRTVTVASS
jgi:hypothetical protein